MEQYGENIYTRIGHDRSHDGKYEAELEVEVPGYLDPIKTSLENSGYILVDFDQWGLTYFSGDDPDLSVNVDELDDYGDKSQIILRKGRLSQDDIDEAKDYLQQIYRKITGEVDAPLMEVYYLQRIYYEILGEIDVEPVEAFEYSSQALLPTY